MFKKNFIKGIILGVIAGIGIESYYLSMYLFKTSFSLSKLDLTTLDGSPLTLSSYKGKPIVLNFLSRNCLPCIKELPEFEKAAIKHKDSIQFLFIMNENIDDINEFRKRYHLDFVHSKLSFEDYGILGVPRTYFLNSNGIIIDSSMGSVDSIQLHQYLSRIK